jgi:hypothetical protein
MNRTYAVLALCAPLSLFAFACDKSGSEAQREADQAQAQAQKDESQAQAESTTRITNAQVEANKKVSEAERDFQNTREDYRHSMQSKLDDLDKKISDLDIKRMKATGKTKAKLDSKLPDVHTRRDAFARDFSTIENDTAATFDASKARLDKEWSDLKSAVDKAD